ncbi:secretory lipase family protein, partial [Mycobacteroides abscessus]
MMAAHAVLDAVRGMHGMRADLVDAPMVMDGYSGGAIATVWAAQEQPTYAPELRFSGAVAGGTPTDYALLYRSMNGALGSGLFAAATIGQAREYPSMVELFGDFAFYMSTLVKDLPQPAVGGGRGRAYRSGRAGCRTGAIRLRHRAGCHRREQAWRRG